MLFQTLAMHLIYLFTGCCSTLAVLGILAIDFRIFQEIVRAARNLRPTLIALITILVCTGAGVLYSVNYLELAVAYLLAGAPLVRALLLLKYGTQSQIYNVALILLTVPCIVLLIVLPTHP